MKTMMIYIGALCLGVLLTLTKCSDDEQQVIEELAFSREPVKSPSINKLAPDFLDSLPVEVSNYIRNYSPVAIQEMKEYGIPASIKLGQAILESGYGTSRLAKKANNHFGIKCRSFGGLPIGELVNGCVEHPDALSSGEWTTARFLSFDSVWASYRAHSIVLSGSRYQDLRQYGVDYQKWAEGLYEKGYAVDRAYSQKLINVIETYHLYKYDSLI